MDAPCRIWSRDIFVEFPLKFDAWLLQYCCPWPSPPAQLIHFRRLKCLSNTICAMTQQTAAISSLLPLVLQLQLQLQQLGPGHSTCEAFHILVNSAMSLAISLSLSFSLSLPLRKYIYNEIINKQTNKYSWYMQLPSMIIYDHLWHLCMSTSWLNHLCWRRGLHGLGRHGLRLLAMGWGRRVLTWMLWNYFIVFLTRVIFVHGASWYDCTFHIWTGNLILCFKIHDIRLGNSVIENRQYWSTFHLISSDTNLKLIIKLC